MIALVAALASKNLAIGYQNRLPWSLPAEKRYFHRLINRRIVVMGYKTWCAINGPIDHALANWVLTSRHHNLSTLAAVSRMDVNCAALLTWQAQQRLVVFSELKQLIEHCQNLAHQHYLMIIGGAQLYAAMLPYAQRLYLTLIDGDYQGDCFFPDWRRSGQWHLSRSHEQTENGTHYQCTIWQKIST